MKKFTVLMILVLAVCQIMAQAPQKLTYQAVVRDANNQLVANTLVGIRVSILQNSATGSVVYSETQMLSTNVNGLVTVNIGEGTLLYGSFTNIDWSAGTFFLKSEIDPNGGSNYSISSTQQLLSVPYALYANEAGNGFSGDYNDLTNRPTIPQIPTDVSAFNNDVPYLTVEQQILSIRNDTIFLTGGSFVKLPAGFSGDYNDLTNLPQIPQIPADISAFNNDVPYLTVEQQILSIRNDTIFLTGGSFVKLPAGFDGDYNSLTNLPQIPQIPADISAFNNDVPYLTAEQQILSIRNDTIFLTGGSFVKLPAGFDGNYNSLTNRPTIPAAANDATLTIQRNGSTVGTFSADASADETVNIAVPTTTSELTNNSGFVTADQLTLLLGTINHRMDSLQTIVSSQNAEISSLSHTLDSMGTFVDSLNGYISQTINNPWNTSVTNQTSCEAYVWHGETYTQSGVYLHGWTDVDGTNNIEALNLTIIRHDTTYLQAEACGSYIWNGITYTESGDYYHRTSNRAGCDSIIFLHLTIYNSTHNVITADSCENYTWHGQTYTESGTYTYAYTNADGCASMDTLHLTIHHGTHNVDTVTACESYIWHDSTYTQSGIYTYTYENAYGCVSVDTLHLTVHYGTHNVESLNACGSNEWHGQTYTESGTYTYAYNNEYNCPSVDTLKVVVVLVDGKSCSLAPCVTDVDGNMYSTVQIGGQCWMRSNLRTTHYADGTAIPTGNISSSDPYYYDSQSNRLDLAIRGYHYNQPAVMHNQSFSTANPSGVQGVCPDGWHVPSENEWQQLFTFVGSQVQHVCDNNYIEIAKALASPTGWRDNGNTCQLGNDVNNNLTGFTAFPTGQWQNDMSCWGTDFVCTFWSSTAGRPFTPGTSPQIGNANGYYGFPVRCVYDISACGTEFEGTHNVETDTTCDSYTWHGQTYTESGAYTYPYKNIYGCASEDTLKLTIHHSTHNVDVRNLFGSYTWYDSIYTEIGTYTYEYTNEYGCPSVDTLHLTRGSYPCPGTPTVTDHEGNVYNTVQIGNQCWTKENMRCTTSPSTGANIFIPGTGGSTSYVSKFARKPNAENGWVRDVTFYGLLYNWNAAVDTFNTSFWETGSNDSYSQNAVSVTFNGHRRGICPQGWHVPSDSEWTQLTNYVSSQEQFLCDHNSANIAKALVSPTGWRINSDSCGVGNSSTNNQTGFTAVPSGYYTVLFQKFGYGAGFWSATQREDVNNIVWGRHIFTDDNPTGMTRANNFYKNREYSVRCLKDTFTSDGTECMGTHNVEIKKANNTYTWHGQTYTESGTYTNIYTNEDGCYSVDTLKLTIVFVDEKSCPGTPSVTDIDGNTYSTVQIGEQCWMRSNLRTTRYADGTAVPAGNSAYSETDPYYYNYENCFTLPERGYYYNWPAVMHGQPSSTTNPSEVQGICPDGWHVPSNLEWKQMRDYVTSKSEYLCNGYYIAPSLASNTGWAYGQACKPGNNLSQNNATGFSAMPVGFYQLASRFWTYGLGGAGCTNGDWFWCSTEKSADKAYYQSINNDNTNFISGEVSKDVGFSVRCVMNAETDSVDYTIDEKSCPGTATVTDIDGNTYGTVQLGEQCWMRSNLRATHYADGTAVSAGNMNFSKTEPYYYDFSGLGSDGTSQFFPLSKRGYLYNWAAAMHGAASSNTNPSQVQGICPDGWHVPSNEEWTQMENYVNSQEQYRCSGYSNQIAKALTSTMGWKSYSSGCYPGNNPSANNATGFNAIPVGNYANNGGQCATERTWFLSSTEKDSASIYYCMLWYNGNYLGRFSTPKDKGFSVRCLRNDCGTHNVETASVVESPSYTWHGQTYNEDGTYTFAYFNEAGCRSVDTLKLKINYFTVDEKSCPGTPSVTDVDGNMYSTVQIGDQCWMRSNLRTTRYADGTTVPVSTNDGYTYPCYYDYSNQRFTLRERGYLYNWPAAMHGAASSNTVPSNVQGICPDGWHLPSDAEWTNLENYVKSQSQYWCGGNSSNIAKAIASTYGWKYYNTDGCYPGTDTATNNATGFGAIPAGLFHNGGYYGACYELCGLWSATQYGATTAYYRGFRYSSYNIGRTNEEKCKGYSVRCLKDTASSGGGDTPCIGTHKVETENACESYSWHGQTYTQSGTYMYAYTNNDGCASVDTLKLTINLPVTTTNSATACESYTWHEQTYTQSGDYTYNYTNEHGCPCTETLHLTIYQPVNTASSATACESYTWNGQTYTQSGDYTQTFTAANGCDSVVTLHLTIYQPVNTTNSATACESYTWHGQIYTQNGDYTYNYTNEYGCPCTETLNLTINHGSHNVFTETAEGSYTWHEQTYTESGTYTYAYTNASGCASVDTLHLTVTSNPPTPPTPPSDTIADGYPCPNAHTVTDHEGNVYNTVQIGTQCWTKENMRCITSPSTGTTILEVYPNGTSYTGKKAYYVNGNSYNTPSYGLLYNWNAAVDTFNTAYGETSTNSNSSNAVSVAFTSHRRGICPQGWHVPSNAEWTQLINYVSSKSRYQCGSTGGSIAKALADTTGWNIYSIPCAMGNDLSANNATGFSALPAGAYFGSFYYFGDAADFWSTTSIYSNSAYYKYLYYDYAGVYQDLGNIYCGISVRCLMDSAIGGDTPCIGTYNVETENACESFTWHGQTYTQSGTYTYSYTNDNGCASMDTLFLTIYNGTHNTYTESAEGSYTWHEQTYSENGTYTYTYNNAQGCASVDTLHLTVTSNPPTPPTPPTPPSDTIADGYPCPNAHTATDHEGNVYNTVLIGSQCWTKENMRCTTSPITGSSLLTDFSSSASKAASWHTNNTSHDPAYGLLYNWCAALDTFKTTGGVPEVASANSSTSLICTISGHRRGICPQGWHVPNNAEWAQLMAYVYSNGYRCSDCSYLSLSADFTSCIAKALSSTTGWNADDGECVVGNDLSANNATGFSALPGGCYSSNSYRNYGQKAYFWSADVSYGYADHVYLSYNYDEMTRIDERMSAKFSVRCLKDVCDCGAHNVESAMDCESHTWHGQTYNTTGTYTYEYTNDRGCASVDTLKLTIQEHVYLETSATACNEYSSHGQTFTSSGTYTYDFTNEHNCPSSETLHLTIYNSEYPTFSVSECESYTWHEQTYTASGTYTHDYTNEHGCPCTETLNLTIYEPETPSTSASACESYTWHGHTYNASGTYTHEFQDLHGCTGTETLHLTIYNGTHTAISAGDCEYYTWHDNDYDQSGIYTYAYVDEHGCACTDTLKLVIQEHVNITTSVEACEYYVWRDSIYTESGTYTANYLNNHGCITTETLILTIHHGTHNSYTEEVCSYYVWHDSTITQSGDYTYAYLDEHGCASVDTLHLTIGSNSCPGTPTVTDHQGNVYNTVRMGSQCWTKENMRCTTLPSTGTTPIGVYLNNDPSTAATYGLLYNWSAAMEICPQGWHLPSVTEWTQMLNYVRSQSEYWCGNNSNYIAKALASETGWVTGAAAADVMEQIASTFLTGVLIEYYAELGYFDLNGACAVCNNPSSNNATCFSALPAGYYFGPKDWDPDGFMSNCWANFFSSTPTSDTTAYGVGIFFFSSLVATASTPMRYGNSVRCVRNEAILPDE